jgi:hypothetical protein
LRTIGRLPPAPWMLVFSPASAILQACYRLPCLLARHAPMAGIRVLPPSDLGYRRVARGCVTREFTSSDRTKRWSLTVR